MLSFGAKPTREDVLIIEGKLALESTQLLRAMFSFHF